MVLSPPSVPLADRADTAEATASVSPQLPLVQRPRRLRRTEGLRRMVRETRLTVDEQAVILETLTSIKRAGAAVILTSFAKDVAKALGSKF
jgi:delta-aminolevulinic acid dehydratase/porphobilinogen synthase